MSPETVTLEDALRLLSLPRTLGEPADGEEVRRRERPLRPVRQEGQGDALARERGAALHDHARRGARAARRSRSSAAAAARRAAAARARRTTRSAASRSCVKDGRFGPYVTDGETNASLRAADSVESITPGAGGRAAAGAPGAQARPKKRRNSAAIASGFTDRQQFLPTFPSRNRPYSGTPARTEAWRRPPRGRDRKVARLPLASGGEIPYGAKVPESARNERTCAEALDAEPADRIARDRERPRRCSRRARSAAGSNRPSSRRSRSSTTSASPRSRSSRASSSASGSRCAKPVAEEKSSQGSRPEHGRLRGRRSRRAPATACSSSSPTSAATSC